MRRAALATAAGLLLSACAFTAAARHDEGGAHVAPAARATLVVSATGVVEVAADQVEIHLGVTSDAKTPEEALSANQAKVEAVRAALAGVGLGEKEVTTSNFMIQPVYEQRPDYRQGPVVTGYSVTNSALVRTKRMELAGKAIQAAVGAGANRIDGVSFGLSGSQGRDEAIAEAARKARADAASLAAAAGVRLGGVLRVTMDPGTSFPIPYVANMMMAAEAMGGAEPTLTPGTIPVRVTVAMEYEIER